MKTRARFDTANAPAVRVLAAMLAVLGCTQTARAQHASDNPIAAADDAFGLTLGLESIGLYGPGNIRGFNPQIAGNVRLDGLYFDQQGGLSNRVVEGSAVRIGVSEIGYAFPAPTGIVDYDLRHTGDGKPSASIVANAGPFSAKGASVDAVLPVAGKDLQLPIGAAYNISTGGPYSNNPGYTSNVANFGAVPEWRINDRWRVRAILDWTRISEEKTVPFVFTAGDFLPPQIGHIYWGQNWAQQQNVQKNFGAIVHGQLDEHWALATGLFRSVYDVPVSYSDLYVNTSPTGLADHVVIGYPDQYTGSTSGEARLTGRFTIDSWRHDVIFLARGRDTQAYYGGEDSVDAGPGQVGVGRQVPQPDFQYTGRTSDLTKLWSMGFAYRAQWKGGADLSIGLQRESYNKTVAPFGLPVSHLTDQPLRGYAQASYRLSDSLAAYAGATQGLEDSGSAPTGAKNHGMVLPDARTWQAEAGTSYALTESLKLISGVFEIEKPYFNLDTNGVDRELAIQRARGIELSLSGGIGKAVHLTAGVLFGEVSVLGPNLAAEGLGPFAFGQPHFQGIVNAEYEFQRWPSYAVDVTAFKFGTSPDSLDNKLMEGPQVFYALGARYKFKIDGDAATLRVQVQDLTDFSLWNYAYTPGFVQFPGRVLFGYLTVDL